jgi:transcriptional regulator with XRE-family HTH domain
MLITGAQYAEIDKVRNRSTLASNLRRLRKAAGLSQYALAEKSGVSRPTIANIETDQYSTTALSTLASLAAALGCSISDLAEPAGGTDPARARVERFLASDWGRVAKPTESEIAWLRSLPEISWLGSEPTDETFYHLLGALRARGGGQQ